MTAGALSMHECGIGRAKPAPIGSPPTMANASHSAPYELLTAPDLMNRGLAMVYEKKLEGNPCEIDFIAQDISMRNDYAVDFHWEGLNLGPRKPSKEAFLNSKPVTLASLASPEAAKNITVHILQGEKNRDILKEVPHGGPLPWVSGSFCLNMTHQVLAGQDIQRTPAGVETPFGIVDGRAMLVKLPGAQHLHLYISTIHACTQAVGLHWMPKKHMYCEAPQGIVQALSVVALLRGRGPPAFNMVPGKGSGLSPKDKEAARALGVNPATVEGVSMYWSHIGDFEQQPGGIPTSLNKPHFSMTSKLALM
ncbi:hypothetical protein DUNSADRAFT_1006 [Dunaliella salina]|uniref:Uncharacterized protein n=1 Tax=Dunaliella salina TaxID=3046 RepID=A0ABQ7FY44_DUNSA|nr:hypothetical protein DUNSADRAFT_1006 [Dunaliella salina]|eukprot:KAF5827279.1 hypothetical protein DUNSADRAFT_1006 [Dunaliella salina]